MNFNSILRFSSLTLAILCLQTNTPAIVVSLHEQQCLTSAYFAPRDNVQNTITQYINEAQASLYVSAFGITNPAIAQALVAAKKRGVDVQVGLDRGQSANAHSQHPLLLAAGIPVFIKKISLFEHNKYIVRDGNSVLMGSTNFSTGAMKQDNTSVILRNCPDIVKEFMADFLRIKERDL